MPDDNNIIKCILRVKPAMMCIVCRCDGEIELILLLFNILILYHHHHHPRRRLDNTTAVVTGISTGLRFRRNIVIGWRNHNSEV